MASGSTAYTGVNIGRAGRGRKTPAKIRKPKETLSQIRARIARTGDFF